MPETLRPLLVVLVLTSAASPVAAQREDSVWTIRAGSYAGQSVRLNTDLATKRSSRFLRISKLKGDSRFVAWSPSRLPAPVAFRGGRGISDNDSLAFWSILREMEADMGMRLFEPAVLSDYSDPSDIIVVDTKNMPHDDGMTLVTWSSPGGIYDARVFLRSTATLHSSRVVAHEMMHALGFGHICVGLHHEFRRGFAVTSHAGGCCIRAVRSRVSRRERSRGHVGARRAGHVAGENGNRFAGCLRGVRFFVPAHQRDGAIGASGTCHCRSPAFVVVLPLK